MRKNDAQEVQRRKVQRRSFPKFRVRSRVDSCGRLRTWRHMRDGFARLNSEAIAIKAARASAAAAGRSLFTR
jgi:hypothetical protein